MSSLVSGIQISSQELWHRTMSTRRARNKAKTVGWGRYQLPWIKPAGSWPARMSEARLRVVGSRDAFCQIGHASVRGAARESCRRTKGITNYAGKVPFVNNDFFLFTNPWCQTFHDITMQKKCEVAHWILPYFRIKSKHNIRYKGFRWRGLYVSRLVRSYRQNEIFRPNTKDTNIFLRRILWNLQPL